MKIELAIPLTLGEISRAVRGTLLSENALIRHVSTDSREMSEDTIFFALGGGEEFVAEALTSGYAVSARYGASISVKSVADALLALASYYLARLPMLKKTVAVTGSVGKSTVKDYTAAILGKRFKTYKTLGNFNNGIGLPLSVLSAPEDTEILVLEMGMNSRGEISRLSEAVRPDLAVITLIGTAHIGNLGSREAIAEAKREITVGLKPCGKVIIPKSEPLLADMQNTLTFGENGNCSVRIIKALPDRTEFDIIFEDGKIDGICLPLGGVHFATDLCIAALTARCLGMSLSDIKQAVSEYSHFIPRQKIIKLHHFSIYDDSYNASLESYRADLCMLADFDGERAAVIGDMLELGDDADSIHRELGRLAARLGINKLYPFGRHANAVRDGALLEGMPRSSIFANTDLNAPQNTALAVCENSSCGALVLVKGSRAVGTERIIERIKEIEGEKND